MNSDQIYAQMIHDDLIQRKKAVYKLKINPYSNITLKNDGLYSVQIEFPNSLGHQIIMIKNDDSVHMFDCNGKKYFNSGCKSRNKYEYCTSVNGSSPKSTFTPSELINTSVSIKADINSGLCLLWCIIFIILYTNGIDCKLLLNNNDTSINFVKEMSKKIQCGSFSFEKIVLESFDKFYSCAMYRGKRHWNAHYMIKIMNSVNLHHNLVTRPRII